MPEVWALYAVPGKSLEDSFQSTELVCTYTDPTWPWLLQL